MAQKVTTSNATQSLALPHQGQCKRFRQEKDPRQIELDLFTPEVRQELMKPMRKAAVEPKALDIKPIPYESWGKTWFNDENGFTWSKEAVIYLQHHLFWESMEEMRNSNNDLDKWSVLKWVFRPAYFANFEWDSDACKGVNRMVHERDMPFSFHNCCIAARVDAEIIREGFNRNLPAEVLQAVLRVVNA